MSRIKITPLPSDIPFRYDFYFSNSDRLFETYASVLKPKVRSTQSDGPFGSWLLSFLHTLSLRATAHTAETAYEGRAKMAAQF